MKPMSRLAAALLCMGCAASVAQTLQPGDLMFTAYNADQDGWAMVALVDLAPGTTLFFSNNAYGAQAGFAPGGGFERWASGPGLVAAGTVLRFSYIDSASAMTVSSGSLSRELVPGSSHLSLSQSSGTLYAYQGSSATRPSVFITAISNGSFDTGAGALAGTGLAVGAGAVPLPAGADFAEYNATRASALTPAGYQALLADPAMWLAPAGTQFAQQAINGTALNVLSVPEPAGPVLLLTGVLTALFRRRRDGTP